MSTQLNQVIEFPIAEATALPLPEFCGPSPDFVPYTWTPEHRSLRAARARSARYAALAFYRIQAQRAAARGNRTAASWYAERAAMYARITRRKPMQPLTGAHDLRDEIVSWRVMADTIAREAHLTADDYRYC